MTRYNKAIIAVVGLLALVALRYFNISLAGFDAVVLELIVSALVALGVYQVPNRA